MSKADVLPPQRFGRPPLSGVRATERIEIVVTTSQREDLLNVAALEGKRLSTVVREAVNEYVADFREKRVFS